MLRQLQDQTPVLRITRPVPISMGGHGATTVEGAVDALEGIPRSWLGAPLGILRLDENGLIPLSAINLTPGAHGHPIDGPRAIERNSRARYRITAVNSLDNITATVSAGTVEVGEKIIYVTADTDADAITLTVNDRKVVIQVVETGVLTPSVITPLADASFVGEVTFITSPMQDSGSRFSYDYELTTGVVSVPPGAQALDLSGYRGIDGDVAITINGKVYTLGQAMTHRSIALEGATSVSFQISGTAKGDYRWVMSSRIHVSTDWEIAKDRHFTQMVYADYENTTDLTSLTVLLPNGEYYVRVRYNATDYQPNVEVEPTVRKPSIIDPSIDGQSFSLSNSFISSSFALEQGIATHVSSDWEISSSPEFTTIMEQVTGTTEDLLQWRSSMNLPTGLVLYVRVRHNAEVAV